MILGLFAGNKLNSSSVPAEKIKFFIITGVGLILFGVLLHITGINPIIKRIWTPAWMVFSGGTCFLLLTFFYWVVDVAGKKSWSFFFNVIC